MHSSPPIYTIPWARGICLHPSGRDMWRCNVYSFNILLYLWLNATRNMRNVLYFSSSYLKHLSCLKSINLWDKSKDCTEANSNTCWTKISYRMEILNLSEAELKSLDSFLRTVLKQIQHLPEKRANEAVYLLLGALPIRTRVVLNQLTLSLMTITGSTTESKIAERQLAMKDLSSKSWFMSVCKTLTALNTVPQVRMICYVTLHLKLSGNNKSTLKCKSIGMKNWDKMPLLNNLWNTSTSMPVKLVQRIHHMGHCWI